MFERYLELLFAFSILADMSFAFLIDRTVRTYSFPDLEFQFVLGAHRAAVNAVSISDSFIVSASGDRSVRLWEAETGKLLRTFDNHHTRGYVFHLNIVEKV